MLLLQPVENGGRWTAGLTFGHSLYGGKAYTSSAQAYLSRDWAIGKTDRVALTFGVETTDYLTSTKRSDSKSLKASWSRNLRGGRGISLTLGLGDTG